MRFVKTGGRPDRFEEPRMDDRTWNLIQSCWESDASKRPTLDEMVGMMIGTTWGSHYILNLAYIFCTTPHSGFPVVIISGNFVLCKFQAQHSEPHVTLATVWYPHEHIYQVFVSPPLVDPLMILHTKSQRIEASCSLTGCCESFRIFLALKPLLYFGDKVGHTVIRLSQCSTPTLACQFAWGTILPMTKDRLPVRFLGAILDSLADSWKVKRWTMNLTSAPKWNK